MISKVFVAVMFVAGIANAQPRTEIVTQTQTSLPAINQQLSISDSGAVAFTGVDQAFLSQLFLSEVPGTFASVSGNVSASRNYLGASIADDGTAVAARERVSGAPPAFIVRRWAIPGPVSAIVGSSVQSDFDSALGFTDINNSGVVAFPGLVEDSTFTALFGSAQRPSFGSIDRLQEFTGIATIRPKIANDGSIVYRGPTPAPSGQILVHTVGASGNPVRIVGTEFTSLGFSPAISPSGRVVAFAGDLSTSGAQQLATAQLGVTYPDGTALVPAPITPGPGVFIAIKVDAVGGSRWIVQRIAGTNGNGQFDPGEVRLSSNVDAGAIVGFLLDAGLGVTDATCNDPTIGVAFLASAVQQAGATPGAAMLSVMLARVSIQSLDAAAPSIPSPPLDLTRPTVLGPVTIARVLAAGQQIDGIADPLQDFSLYNPINQQRQIAAWTSSGGSNAAILRAEYPHLFRQMRQNDATWSGQRIVPATAGPATFTFGTSGCTITALAMASSWMGLDATPTSMRDWLLRQRLLNPKDAETQVAQFFARNTAPGLACCRMIRAQRRPTIPRPFDSIADALRTQTTPVLLWVPSTTRDAARVQAGEGHYVLAYALSPTAAPTGPVQASDILIADPMNWPDRYTDGVSGRWDRSGILSQLTLADYFDRINTFLATAPEDPTCPPATQWCPPRQRRGLHYDVKQWFDSGRFTRISGGITQELFVPILQRLKAITTFESVSCLPPGSLDLPSRLHIASPLEVALIDPVTGQRFASSLSIALPGDTLLTKIGTDADTSTDDDDPSPNTDLDFPPYTVEIPDSLIRRNVQVQLVGTGSGNYTVTYLPGTADLTVSAPLSGSIEAGQIVNGSFTVSDVTPCPGDYDNSGSVDLLDLLAFNGDWSSNLGQSVAPGTNGDYNNSGTVDLLDLLAFNGDWSSNLGQACP